MKTEKVGYRIKTFMEQRGLTLDELACRTGLDTDFLWSVVNEDVYPSHGPLLKIARVLGVRLGTFLDDQIRPDPPIIRRAERQQELSMLRAKDQPVALKFYSLGSRGRISRYKIPKHFTFVDSYPMTAREKVQKYRLREMSERIFADE